MNHLKKFTTKVLILVLALVQAMVLFGGCALFPSEQEPDIPSLKTPKPVEYAFYTVRKGTLKSTVSGTGKVSSIFYKEHSFKQGGGKVKELHVTLGQYVEKGQPLVEIENAEVEEKYLAAEIEYQKKQLEYNTKSAQYRNGSISELEYHISELELKSAKMRYDDLKKAYEQTILVAEISGKVVYINTKYTAATTTTEIVGGDTIVAIDSEDPKYTFVLFERLTTGADYTPTQFRVGEVLELKQATDSGNVLSGAEAFKGEIVGTDAMIKDFQIELGLVAEKYYFCKMQNPPEGLSNGDVVKYDYTEFVVEECIIIPTSALYEFNGETFVYMLDASTNLKKEVPVQIGYRTSSQAQVLDGLKVGEIIIEG